MRRRRTWAAAAVALLAVVAASVVVTLALVRRTDGAMTASSQVSGHGAASAAPGADGSWRPDDEGEGAWLQRSWTSPIEVRRVVVRGGTDNGGITAGYLSFSDGSQLAVRLAQGSTEIALTPRRVVSMRFTVTEVAGSGMPVGVDELDADGGTGPDGPVATMASSGGDVGAQATLEGVGSDGGNLTDAEPGTTARIDRDGVALSWAGPRELTRVAVAGAPGSSTIRRATLRFSDGSTLPVGAVTTDAARPTVVAFMPRVTTSLTLVVDEIDGDGELWLSGVGVFQRGAEPDHPAGLTGAAESEPTSVDTACDPSTDQPRVDVGVVVRCPTNGSPVGDLVPVYLTVGPAYSSVQASAWSTQPGGPATSVVRADADDQGLARIDLDVGELPAGPFVVAIAAIGPGPQVEKAFLQLVRPGALPRSPIRPPAGRTMVFDDDFDESLSISRSGEGADYVAGKPESGGVTDFGDAIFADPTLGLGNVGQQDGYLRLAAEPRPPGFVDPQGWGREHLGGMLASARPGGSGFAAQYGYFEARMLAPAAPGTWPAFWMLTTPNLVEQQPVTAEVDAVELYGHDPTSACHTSHQYPDPDGIGAALCGHRWESERRALQWHTYGVDIRPDRIVYFIDGQRVGDAAQVEAGGEPMFFMIDLALGGGWPVALGSIGERADLYVDWVRVYV